MGPACATHGENCWRAVKALPALTGFQGHAKAFQTAQPGSQQWRSLHLLWKDAARGSHKSFNAETVAPFDQRFRWKGANGGFKKFACLAIAREKTFQWF